MNLAQILPFNMIDHYLDVISVEITIVMAMAITFALFAKRLSTVLIPVVSAILLLSLGAVIKTAKTNYLSNEVTRIRRYQCALPSVDRCKVSIAERNSFKWTGKRFEYRPEYLVSVTRIHSDIELVEVREMTLSNLNEVAVAFSPAPTRLTVSK